MVEEDSNSAWENINDTDMEEWNNNNAWENINDIDNE